MLLEFIGVVDLLCTVLFLHSIAFSILRSASFGIGGLEPYEDFLLPNIERLPLFVGW
jgi:hypothetical protein